MFKLKQKVGGAIGAALMVMSASSYSATAVINLEGLVTEYNGPAALSDALGGLEGAGFTANIVIPNFELYNPENANLGQGIYPELDLPYNGLAGTTVPLDGSVPNGPGFSLAPSNPASLIFEGVWMKVANPEFDPTLPACFPWQSGCVPNVPDFWNVSADHDGLLGEASLTFDEYGLPTSFSYTVGREVLSSVDAFIQDPTLLPYGFSGITLTIDGFSLLNPLNEQGWGLLYNDIIEFEADSYHATVTAVSTVPVPAALPLFAGALGALGMFARRRKASAS